MSTADLLAGLREYRYSQASKERGLVLREARQRQITETERLKKLGAQAAEAIGKNPEIFSVPVEAIQSGLKAGMSVEKLTKFLKPESKNPLKSMQAQMLKKYSNSLTQLMEEQDDTKKKGIQTKMAGYLSGIGKFQYWDELGKPKSLFNLLGESSQGVLLEKVRGIYENEIKRNLPEDSPFNDLEGYLSMIPLVKQYASESQNFSYDDDRMYNKMLKHVATSSKEERDSIIKSGKMKIELLDEKGNLQLDSDEKPIFRTQRVPYKSIIDYTEYLYFQEKIDNLLSDSGLQPKEYADISAALLSADRVGQKDIFDKLEKQMQAVREKSQTTTDENILRMAEEGTVPLSKIFSVPGAYLRRDRKQTEALRKKRERTEEYERIEENKGLPSLRK